MIQFNSKISRSINRGTLSLQRALQILAMCGVSEVGVEAEVTVTNE
jgi:hypothetical protein